MEQQQLIPHLFRMEYRKIIAVLCKFFGTDNLQIAEDIASETFLQASETWGLKGLPENPAAWLYTVAKNKAKNYIKHNAVFQQRVARQVRKEALTTTGLDVEMSMENITDSQLQMIFAICHPAIAAEAQIGLALRFLCGFGTNEIADAFLTSRDTITKRLFRAKEKLREENVRIEFPDESEVERRLETVLLTLYLLFNEGYYSAHQDITLRKDLCAEAMRLTHLLLQNSFTAQPPVYALLALMSFHASRFEARVDHNGEIVLYEDQDENLWDRALIEQGEYYLGESSRGDVLSKFHLEAAIAHWHTQKADSSEKWESILQLYNKLLAVEYSPIAALNRTYALSKANGKEEAIREAEKLDLTGNHLYHSLLGVLYTDVVDEKAAQHFEHAIAIARSAADKLVLSRKLENLRRSKG